MLDNYSRNVVYSAINQKPIDDNIVKKSKIDLNKDKETKRSYKNLNSNLEVKNVKLRHSQTVCFNNHESNQ